ncbi:hypothetical protein EJB05_14542 [Eragrostis curvula]|uniref:Uncharacterized protein n=1 Tax=Eragrostis curvula TaxID=38414 RepID=A0A5J9VX93_9POAL|nr:hypothetical protein EJB05_14542 [Eragrostis curvula]
MENDGTDAAGSSIADGIALFFFVALILWGASLDQRHHYAQRHVPQVRGGAGQGRTRRWVDGDVHAQCHGEAHLLEHGSFFGVHVTSRPVTLNYYQLVLASGNGDGIPPPKRAHSTQAGLNHSSSISRMWNYLGAKDGGQIDMLIWCRFDSARVMTHGQSMELTSASSAPAAQS